MAPHLAIVQGTHNVANLQKIMTKIGGVCLITIGIWCVIELGVQFGHYGHSCYLGEGALLPGQKVQRSTACAALDASLSECVQHGVYSLTYCALQRSAQR